MRMRIAFFNWRDIRNPMAGGAEVYNHQILKRLVSQGHHITVFTSSFSGSPERESIDGIEHVRYGGRFLMYPKSLLCYRKHVRGRYDVIVEAVNGMPFFTGLFAKEKVIPLVYQLTRKNWYSGLPQPLAFLGYHLEDSFLRAYRSLPTMTISESTKSDLENLGFRDVRIVKASADIEPPAGVSKEEAPTLIYLGRLTKSKRVDHAIRAFQHVRQSLKDARLWVAGAGPELNRLEALVQETGLSDSTTFFGKVSQEKKAELLSKAHLMLFPAVREGWGITVLEANACSTPAVGYDVPGLKDSISDGVNGILISAGDHQEMAARTLELLNDNNALQRMSRTAAEHSKGFSWDDSAGKFASFLEEVIG